MAAAARKQALSHGRRGNRKLLLDLFG